MPFVRGEFTNRGLLDPVAFLGFLGSAFVSKVRGRYDRGGACDDDVAWGLTRDDSPLKELVRQTIEPVRK